MEEFREQTYIQFYICLFSESLKKNVDYIASTRSLGYQSVC